MWGTDPAAFLEAEDDVLAYNLRVGLMTRLAPASEPEDDRDKHLAGISQAHRYGEELRAVYG